MTTSDPRRADTLGLLLMIASAACFALMAPLARGWLQEVDPQSVVLARAVVMVIVFRAWASARGVSLRGHDRRGLLLRGFVGYLAISCYVWSTQHLPPGLAVLLQYSHPVFVAALAPMVLKERPGPLHWPLVIAGFGGLALALGVGAPEVRVDRAVAIGLGGALLSGIAYMTVRRIAATESSLTIIFWFALVMLPCSALGSALSWSPLDALAREMTPPLRHVLPDTAPEWLAYLGIVAAGLVGQVVLTEGLARAGAARAVAVTMAGPVFGIVFDLLFFARTPSARALAGTLLVVAALTLLGLLKPPAALTEGEAE